MTITSGFRTRARNSRVGGASNSQHMYGIAADNQIASRPNRRVRDSARATAFAAIFCYSQDRHNHFDIRSNNPDDGISDTATADPYRDAQGRDLQRGSNSPCYGESGTSSTNIDLNGAVDDGGQLDGTYVGSFDATIDDGVLDGVYNDPDE